MDSTPRPLTSAPRGMWSSSAPLGPISRVHILHLYEPQTAAGVAKIGEACRDSTGETEKRGINVYCITQSVEPGHIDLEVRYIINVNRSVPWTQEYITPTLVTRSLERRAGNAPLARCFFLRIGCFASKAQRTVCETKRCLFSY